jgi:hypothetical protein
MRQNYHQPVTGSAPRKDCIMRSTFFKGTVLGAVVAVVMAGATAAVAGTGVGGAFNLGQTNTVNAPSALSGATNSAQLKVANAGTGTGVSINVAAGKAPLTVNSATKVNNLNADELDGLDSSQLQRNVTGTCSQGTAISRINTDGTVYCASSSVNAISQVLLAHSTATQTFAGAVELDYMCFGTWASVHILNASPNDETLNWMFSQGGTSSTVNADGSTLPSGSSLAFDLSGSRLEGQFIVASGAMVTTVNLHIFYNGGCEYTGTAESAAVAP